MQRIKLSDITLRSCGCALSFREKLELAKLLDRLNLSTIELSPIANKKIDSLLIKSIAGTVKNAALAVPISKDMESIDLTWAALKDAKHPRLQLKAPMSAAQMEYFWHKKPDKLLVSISELIAHCRELCEDVEFIADDACRSERDFLCRAVKCAIEAGATSVTLCDAAGLMFPEEFAAFIDEMRTSVPELKSVKLGVMCSDALSMASACAIAAVRAGASEVKLCSCMGEITRTEDFAAILYNRGAVLGLSADIRNAELHRILGQIDWMCRSNRSTNSPFDLGVRDHADEGSMTLCEHDDRAAVAKVVEKLGYDLSEEDMIKVYEAFKTIAVKKDSVSARELDSIVASAAMQVPPTYKLQTYVINCGSGFSASAHLRILRGEEVLEGVCLGDGPIDAAFLAIEQILHRHYELDDFQIQSVTEGREAMGETLVRLRSNGRLYSGRGISTDIVGASLRAYLNALNKIVYEEVEA